MELPKEIILKYESYDIKPYDNLIGRELINFVIDFLDDYEVNGGFTFAQKYIKMLRFEKSCIILPKELIEKYNHLHNPPYAHLNKEVLVEFVHDFLKEDFKDNYTQMYSKFLDDNAVYRFTETDAIKME